jgi:hypothetical protein
LRRIAVKWYHPDIRQIQNNCTLAIAITAITTPGDLQDIAVEI